MSFETWVQIGIGIVSMIIVPLLSEPFWRGFALTLAGFCFAIALWQFVESRQLHREYFVGGIAVIVVLLSSIFVWSVPARQLVHDAVPAQPAPKPEKVIASPVEPPSPSLTIGNIIENKGIITQGQSGGTNTIINQGTLSPKAKKELQIKIQSQKTLRHDVAQFIATTTYNRDHVTSIQNPMDEINKYDQEMGRILRERLGNDEGAATLVRITSVDRAANVKPNIAFPDPRHIQADYHARVRLNNLTELSKDIEASISDLERRL